MEPRGTAGGDEAVDDRPVRDFPVGPFLEAATRWLVAPTPPSEHAEPSPAATVMLVRGAPLEVFMIERAATMDFAPSTWVFPGGRVDRQDADAVGAGVLDGRDGVAFDAATASTRLGASPEIAGAVTVCAFREVFEEAGVLLAQTDEDLADRREGARDDQMSSAAAREALETHRVTFVEVLAGRRLMPEQLIAVDRWITPPFEHRRFDTWFFTAALPPDMTAAAVSRESQRGRWVRPEAMLAEMEVGEVRLLPPTRIALERLSRAASADQAIRQAGETTFAPTRPVAVMGEGGPFLRAAVNL